MATWHQQQAMVRNPCPLWHESKWTVVEDPPGGSLCTSRFDTAEEAQTYERNIGRKHTYILAPMQHQMAMRVRK